MEKLIEVYQEDLIVCDNPKCDFVVKSPNPKRQFDISGFVNKACPKCRRNLCTTEDHKNHLFVMGFINFLNKWFSWLTFLGFGIKSGGEIKTKNGEIKIKTDQWKKMKL